MTDSELVEWVKPDHRKLWTFRVSDKFGNSGLTGIISLEVNEMTVRIIDFVLSCRVMGRKIEETMLYTLITYAQPIGVDEIHADYFPTPKNQPCLAFWQQSGFVYNNVKNRFTWQTKQPYASPDGVQIEWEEFNKGQAQQSK